MKNILKYVAIGLLVIGVVGLLGSLFAVNRGDEENVTRPPSIEVTDKEEPSGEASTDSSTNTEEPEEEPVVYSEGLAYTMSVDGEAYYVNGIGTCTDTEIVIPPLYKDLPVTGIKDGAFSGCDSLTTFKLPSTVTYIGGSAFANCGNLQSVIIPNTVEGLGESVFSGCYNIQTMQYGRSTHLGFFFGASTYKENRDSVPASLKTVTFTGSSIPDYAFYNCTSLVSVYGTDELKVIGESAFDMYDIDAQSALPSALEDIPLTSSVTTIGKSAFRYCTEIESVTIPSGVKVIQSTTFGGCTGLKSLTLNEGLCTIGSYAFSNNQSLESITLPGSLTIIDDAAFNVCFNLKSIYCEFELVRFGNAPWGASNAVVICKE